MEETLISCTLSAHSHCEDRLTFSFEFTGHSVSITYARCIADHCQISKPLEDFSLQSVSPLVFLKSAFAFSCVSSVSRPRWRRWQLSHTKCQRPAQAASSRQIYGFINMGFSLLGLGISMYNTTLIGYRESCKNSVLEKSFKQGSGGMLIADDQSHRLS